MNSRRQPAPRPTGEKGSSPTFTDLAGAPGEHAASEELAEDGSDQDEDDIEAVLSQTKARPGSVSLDSLLEENPPRSPGFRPPVPTHPRTGGRPVRLPVRGRGRGAVSAV
ncbi:hypothetical protein AB0A71_04075 [Kitasatospora aureofaciens]|uniref:hypothetical protein n=1 Tax=Kitasatospora aureofaciens TaxID=1894 RepID=UPI0033FDB48A